MMTMEENLVICYAILKDDRFNGVEITDIKANRGNVIVSITVTTSDDEEIQMEGVELDV